MIYTTNYNTPIGKVLIASDGEYITGLWFEGQKYFAKNLTGKTTSQNDKLEIFNVTKNWLDRYFNCNNPDVKELKIKLEGTQFQKDVWKILCEIPYGTTTTYKKIAQTIAKKYNKAAMSAQAVGNAVGHNPILIIVPCHRVIASDCKLTGYAGGIDKKAKLLEIEKG